MAHDAALPPPVSSGSGSKGLSQSAEADTPGGSLESRTLLVKGKPPVLARHGLPRTDAADIERIERDLDRDHYPSAGGP